MAAEQAQPVAGRGTTEVQPAHIVSMAGMPLPQWLVARVSDSRAMLAPLEGAQRRAWWLAAGVMAACMVLLAAFMVWMAQPLARLCHSALQLAQGGRSDGMKWPGARGEVGALVKVFEGQMQQSAQQREQRALLEGQFQAILDNASVGIVITRQGILEVVGRQACQMLARLLRRGAARSPGAHPLWVGRRLRPIGRTGSGRIPGPWRV